MNHLEEVPQYLQTLYDGLEGYIYAPVKNSNNSFSPEFFAWPDEMAKFMVKIRSYKDQGDLYAAPAIYRGPGDATKAGILHSQTVWCDFDGNYDESIWGDVPPPSLEIQSSTVGRRHCYWKLSDTLRVPELERLTRALSYHLGSDPSGWDATQLLRPPGTLNSKRGVRTRLLVARPGRYSPADFAGFVDLYDLPEVPTFTGSYPDVGDVLSKHPGLSGRAWRILMGKLELADRSNALMELGYILAELGTPNDAMMSILLEADEKVGKFLGRKDRQQRTWDIVVRAKVKYPEQPQKIIVPTFTPSELLKHKVEVDWAWEGYLPNGGMLVLSGAPGVGKSQLALDALAHIATATPFLGHPTKAMKVGYLSLEMNPQIVGYIIQKQIQKWGPKYRSELESNLVIYAHGEALYLDSKEGQEEVERLVRDHSLRGLVIDSLAATSAKEFSNEEVSKRILDFLISIKEKYGCFIWLVHHNRKATSENKKPNALSDILGSVVISARPDTAVILYNNRGTIMFMPRKTRLSSLSGQDFEVIRGSNLNFTRRDKPETNPSGPVEVIQSPTGPKVKFGFQ